MSSPLSNRAAWLNEKFDKDFLIGPGPDQSSAVDDEVIVKVAYVAINPSEWKVSRLNCCRDNHVYTAS
jgi:NADPH:quinone reductase-like Zn-dependent oxidoreductase